MQKLLALTLNNGLDTAAGSSGAGYTTTGGGTAIYELLGGIIAVVLGLLGVVLLLLTIYAGWLWMTAQGDPKKVEKAQAIMRNAVVGLVLVLSAYAISSFVITSLPGTSSSAAGEGGADPEYSSEEIWGG